MRNRLSRLVLALVAAAALSACTDVAASLPARPSPVPTLARLPSVTPVTPRPTAPPTPTPIIVVTPTPRPLFGTVTRPANVRSGPGTEFGIVAVQDAGDTVVLERRSGDWYRVRTAEGLDGWMSGTVLEIAPETSAAVPEGAP
jgi:uncharacterized protein YgiM (DUF1202 family)